MNIGALVVAGVWLATAVTSLYYFDKKPYVDKTEKCVHKEIPSVIYDMQKKQCVLTYKDTMIVRECR